MLVCVTVRTYLCLLYVCMKVCVFINVFIIDVKIYIYVFMFTDGSLTDGLCMSHGLCTNVKRYQTVRSRDYHYTESPFYSSINIQFLS